MEPQETRSPSQIIPVLVAALVCDVAVADPSTGKKNLIGIFDRITVSKFPTQRRMSIYVKLADAEGFYKIEIRYVQVPSGKILATAVGDFEIRDRLQASDFFLSLPPLLIPEKGRYEFQVWANDVFLGATFIDAISPISA